MEKNYDVKSLSNPTLTITEIHININGAGQRYPRNILPLDR